ncbi:4746_t:CDS:2 [Cetraspora pellucida]|uniref:4746_t:CDS:1 n=1 Tax=Cetraspora pellucida TaxID=1433469 RepID=A0A9N9EUJ8_9GLOM|nr:4746_t:CDS:2 [Cetraspora pellucida]
MFNTNFLGDEPDFNMYLLNNKPNIGPNNKPNMKPNNEPNMEPDNKPDMEPEPIESDIESIETNLDCNDESSDKSNGWSSDEDISLINFAYHNGFSVRKYHSEKLNRKCIRHTYLYRYFSIYKPVKDKSLEKQRNKSSAQIDCPWKIHIRFQKKSYDLRVFSFVDKHESHPLTPVNCQFASQYRCLTQEISKDIKFYTQEGHLGATDQYHLLKASYSHHTLYKKAIYNAIQQFHNEKCVLKATNYVEPNVFMTDTNLAMSSQRAEATNSVIKKQLNYRNISLYNLFIELEKRLATEPIDNIIKNFLMPTSLKKQQDQMNLSAQYHATRVSHKDQYNKQIQEIDDKYIDDIFDYPQALTSHIFQQFNNSITMFKDTISNSAVEQSAVILISQFDISNFEVGVQPNYDTQAKTNTISLLCVGIKDLDQNLDNYQNIQKRYYTNQEKIKKWTFYYKLWGVAYKATEIATNAKDYSLLEILNNYINRSIHESSFQTKSQISSSSKENQVIEENDEVKQIQNLIKRYGKGRLSGRPTKKLCIQNSLEKEQLVMASQNIDNNNSNIKKYKYSLCNSLFYTKAHCSLNPKRNRQLLQKLPL